MRYKPAQSLDAIAVAALDVGNIEIVVDDGDQDRIELYILDSEGTRIEGGTFDKEQFMAHVRTFYNNNY